MSEIDIKVPELRFGEFDGDWEEKRIENLCSHFKSGNGITSDNIFQSGKYPVYGGNGLRGYTDTYTHTGFYFLIGRQGALCGNINRSYNEAFISEHAIAVQGDENSDTEWLAQRLDYYDLNRLSESSAQPGLAVNKLLRFKLIVPTKEEQQKIASFLTSVDEKIDQQTAKIELLEKYKKGVMQKIFSQEIRFKDDDGNDFEDWVVKRLGEVATFYKGKGISKSDIVENGANKCIRYGQLYTHYNEVIDNVISSTNLPIKDLILSKKNDVIIPASGETQIDIATASCVMHDNIALSGDLNIIRTNSNGVFLAYYLNNALKLEIARLSQGISVVHLYSSQLKMLHLSLPSLPEQKKIADFLTSIDNKIDEVNRQLASSQSFKKGLLQGMFV